MLVASGIYAMVSAVNDCNWIHNYLRDAGVSNGVKMNNHNNDYRCSQYNVMQHAQAFVCRITN